MKRIATILTLLAATLFATVAHANPPYVSYFQIEATGCNPMTNMKTWEYLIVWQEGGQNLNAFTEIGVSQEDGAGGAFNTLQVVTGGRRWAVGPFTPHPLGSIIYTYAWYLSGVHGSNQYAGPVHSVMIFPETCTGGGGQQ